MSRPQRLAALAIALVAALMCLGMVGWEDRERDGKRSSIYTCNVWNDRSWAGCP